MAVAGMILGIIGVVFAFIPVFRGICGHPVRGRRDATGGRRLLLGPQEG